MDKGIVLSWKNEKITLFLSVLKEKDTGLAQTSWESYQRQMSSASDTSELYLQVAIQYVGPVWGLVPPYVKACANARSLPPGLWCHRG